MSVQPTMSMSDVVSMLERLKIDDSVLAKLSAAELEKLILLARIAEQDRKISALKAERKLKDLEYISAKDQRDLPLLDICVPDHINVDAIVGPVQSLVDDFNKLPAIIEEHGSIGKANSVHHLWHRIFQLLSKTDFGSFSKDNVRVMYEWNIPDPVGVDENERDHHIDFAFLPRDMSALSWMHLRGGLELKINGASEEVKDKASMGPAQTALGELSGFIANKGLAQTANHAGKCVLTHWTAAGQKGAHAAFCCFADSQQFGVVRVRITKDNEVLLDVSPVYILTGIGQGDAFPLRLLAHLLYSPAQDLVAAELICLPCHTSPVIKGRNENEQEVEWAPDLFLGRGGFAEVFIERESPFVIKRAHEEVTKRSLVPEHLALTHLQGREGIPVLKDVLYDENNQIEALKFQDIGISLWHYLHDGAYSEEELNAVLHAVGSTLVRVLQVAHSLGVMHIDVRQPNILLVPRDEHQSKTLVTFFRDITAGDAPSFLASAETFRVVLNDWGNASITTDSEPVSSPGSDLEALVNVFLSNSDEHGLSVTYKGEKKVITKDNKGWLGFDGSDELWKAARSGNYDELCCLLQALTFTPKK